MSEGKIKALMPEGIYAVVCTSKFPESYSHRIESDRTKPLKILSAMMSPGARP